MANTGTISTLLDRHHLLSEKIRSGTATKEEKEEWARIGEEVDGWLLMVNGE